REIVEKKMKEKSLECKCIRCREVGHKFLKEGIIPDLENIKLIKMEYQSSNGIDIFLSFEDVKNDILIGFLRLRYPSKFLRKELENSTIVREIHVYGSMVPVGEKLKNKDTWQHLGFGSKLLNEAERISKENFDAKKIVVISGIGVKEYFLRKGYIKDGPYVSRKI
ncbi:MAG: GNAT family N-acetyltransferase, partial [Nitrososphaerota archaeon]